MRPFTTRHRIASGLGILSVALAACGSSSSTTSGQAAPPEETVDPNAVNGGTMNIGIVQEPTSFMAAGITDSMTFSYAVDAPITEGLLWYKSTDQTSSAKTQADFWRPDLATEVPTTANGDVKTSGCKNADAKMCVTWKLRSGVKWHDGTTFSSHDVCATWNLFYLKYGLTGGKNPTTLVSTSGWDQAIKCTEDNANQATIDFKAIYAPYLAISTGVYGVIPSKQLDAAFAANTDLEKTPQTVDLTVATGNPDAFKGTDTLDKIIVGTGPYVLSSYTPTRDITLVRNKNYWDKKHPGHLDKIVFHVIADVQSQLNAVKAGGLDMGLDYGVAYLKDLRDVAKGGRVKVETIPKSGAEKVDINICAAAHGLCGGTPARANTDLADPKLRHAMLEALNRQSYIDTLAAGVTVVPADSWLYLGAGYTKAGSVGTTPYNPAKAMSDLDAAGYKIGANCHDIPNQRADPSGTCLSFDFALALGGRVRAEETTAVQTDLAAVGIATTISTNHHLFSGFDERGVLYRHEFDLAINSNTMSAPGEPDGYWSTYESTQIPTLANNGQGDNDTGEDNPVVDKAMNDGRNSLDLKARATAYQQAAIALAQDLPELPLYQQVTVNSYTSKLKDLQRNDLVWTFNIADWYCSGGTCQA